MNHNTSLRVFALTAVLASGCGDELDRAWKIKTFRIFGTRIENTSRAMTDPRVAEASPGETVRISLSYFDPSTTARPVQVAWVFCAQTTRMGNTFGCSPTGAIVAMGVEANVTIPNIQYGVDATGRARIQGIGIVCAGGMVTIDPATMQPKCVGDGAEGVTMTRSISVRTSETDPPNHNPAFTEVVLYPRGDLTRPIVLAEDGSTVVPRCPAGECAEHVIELRVREGSRENYRTFDLQANTVIRPERLQFGYFTTTGEMDLSFVVPMGPVRNKWKAVSTLDTADFVFTALDQRGGFEQIRRRVRLQ
jgi:hypothetical protein